MAHDRLCPRCGRPLPADARPGTCPACLLRAGLEPGPDAAPLDASNGDEVTLGFESTSPGRVLESLARSIGSIPRVLLPDTRDDDRGVAVIKPSSDEMPPLSERGDRYLLFGEIARGGMGAVLKGRDPDLGRDLAVKVLLEGHRDKPDLLRRFVEEAQIGGQLQHPGIVPVYELGTFADSRPYFTMKLVKGRTLAQLLKERGSPGDELPRFLGIFEQVCQTVAYAHARGVIHRDLKPTNIMVGSFGEVQVMDWGLAKVLKEGGIADEPPVKDEPAPVVSVIQTVRSGSDAEASQAGSALGTPAYMAPEQAGGDVEHVDRRADVFGLGSILCEILTGQPAYTGRTQAEVMRKAMRGDTGEAVARLGDFGADGDLIALARDCLAVEPEDRPRDAGVVAGRIAGYLAGVQERLRAAERARAAADARAEGERKRRRLALALAAAVIALMASAGIGMVMYLQERRDASARLAFALSEAAMRRYEARVDARGDPTRWEAAVGAANQARGLLGPLIDAASRREALALVDQIAVESHAAEGDRILLSAVRDVRCTVANERAGAPGDASYAAAFRGAGLDVDALGPMAAGARIRAKPDEIALELVAALDDWALRRRRARPDDREGWSRLFAAARAADRDVVRNQVRGVWEEPDRSSRDAHLLDLARQARSTWSPETLRLLADALAEADLNDAAVALIRRVFELHTRDVWLNYRLARLLEAANPPRLEEAIGHYQVAWALRPEIGHALVHALEGRGRGDEALAVRHDVARFPVGPNPPHSLCLTWYNRTARASIDASLQGLPDRKSLEQRAEEFAADLRKSKDAGTEAGLRSSLGNTLLQLGRLQEAITSFRAALQNYPHVKDTMVRPSDYPLRLAELHKNLSVALAEVRDYQGALDECRTAHRLRPHDVTVHEWLAILQLSMGDTASAMGSIREALEIDPGHVGSRATRSSILLVSGRFAEAVPALEEAATRLAAAGWAKESAIYKGLIPEARWLAGQVDSLRERDAGALKGREEPEAPEWAEYAAAHGRPALAARLYGAVLTAVPTWGDDRKSGLRLRAARAAARAGCGEGNDDPRPDESARAGLRKHAMEWLRADWNLWTKHLDSGTEAARGEVREALLRWKVDPDLAGIREAEAVAKLPAEEQPACRKLWADVDALLARLKGGRP